MTRNEAHLGPIATALLLDASEARRNLVASQLNARFCVTAAAGKSEALAALEREPPDLMMLAWCPDAGEVVARVRACEDTKHTYVVALLDGAGDAGIVEALEAGVDDFVRSPSTPVELLARASAPQRIARWKVLPQPERTPASAVTDLRKLDAFDDMGRVVSADLEQFFGEVEISEQWLVSGELRGASIPMSVTTENAEIRVSIVVQAQVIRQLAGILLGNEDATPPELDDMLRELANTAGGAVKRAADKEGVAVTTGLPVNDAPGPVHNEMTRCWTMRLATGGSIGIIGEIHRRSNQRVAAGKLQEGMILTHDVLTAAGATVMPAGTRLTMSAVRRLGSLLDPRTLVDVTLPSIM